MSDKVMVSSSKEGNGSSDKDECNEDVICELPEEHVSNPGSSEDIEGNRRIVLTFMKMSDSNLEMIEQFTAMFNSETLNHNVKWDDRVTHFVINTQSDNLCSYRSFKFLHALFSDCFIVNFYWIQHCLKSRTLLPEIDFMPLDTSGDPSPLTAWRVRRGIIDSPMDWTKNCILYFHTSTSYHAAYLKSQVWALRAGFAVAKEMADLNNKKYSMRLILVDTTGIEDVSESSVVLPNAVQIIEWLTEYKSVTVTMDWFMDCLFRYKFVFIEFKYQAMKLNNALIHYSDMDGSMFQLNEV